MFDPYHKWLGIPPEQRPPTHYQLLHLAETEKDAEVIEEAAIRQTTHLRSYQLGPHAELCTKLLNEVAVARKTLLTPALRQNYDAELARKSGATKKPAAKVPARAPASRKFDDLESLDDDEPSGFVSEGSRLPKRSRGRKPGDRPRIRKPASNLPLWIGLGVGGGVIVIVMVVGLALALRGDGEGKKKPVVVVDNKKNVINPLPVRDVVRDGVKDNVNKDDVPDRKVPLPVNNVQRNPAQGRTLDLVALFDPADVVKGQGKWSVANGRLECSDMHLLPRTQFPYKPPAEYDYTVKFSQTRPRNGISMIMPNGLGRQFYWNVARDNGTWWTLSSSMNGLNNLNSRFDSFRVGEPCTATIEVRKDGVRCFIDGAFVGQHNDYSTMNSDNWRQMRNIDVLGLACDDPTTFHEVKVVEVREPGTLLRDPAAVNPNPPANLGMKPVALTKDWGEIFDEDGDCQIQELPGGGLRMTVPGTHHGINVRTGAINAPRMMKSVDGDFEIQVKVGGTLEPTPKSSAPGAVGFNGAGIILLHDKLVVRLERTAWVGNDGRLYGYPLLFEIHRDNRVENYNVPGRLLNEAALKNPLFIRLTRSGNKLLAAYSNDGNNWVSRPPVTLAMPERVQLGVSANSTSTAPYQVEFSEVMFGSKEP